MYRIFSKCYFVISIVTTKFIIHEAHFSRGGMAVTLRKLSLQKARCKEAPFSDSHATSSKCKYRSYRKKQTSSSHTTDATKLMEAQIMPPPAEFISFPAFSTKAPLISGRWDISWSKPRPYLSRRVFKLRSCISIC